MAKRILVIAYDPSLLLTRKLLFEEAGYEVTTAEGFVAVCEEAQKQKFDLAILGHTVPLKDKQPIIARLRQNSRAPILAVLKHYEAPVPGADLSVETDPTVLLSAVRRLLGR